ncbi:MICOS complex subunit MIC19 [Diachasma alloeum]|uniref:MICOS complex subunit MIC19 n=1 Tax=Diachasma alloeum TaxID=454923 RepID=UPI0007381A33|nr:MICOS complex subunit MIC19 [Diachasma alloeum]XP_015118532.1 MICOS complex subunit MIC19 [Diachasma alloeum]XP_015118537.1 MICOS complex subunit MIC19 [Diachasma alloeum]
MGQSQSARKLTINNEESVIQISTDLADRLATRSRKPQPGPDVLTAPPQSPVITPVSPSEGYPAVHTHPEYTITAYKMQQQKELELQAHDQYWQERLNNLKLAHERINRIFQEEYKRAMDEVTNAKGNKNINLDTTTPACGADKEKVLRCYQENPKEILKCSSLVEEFNHCVDQRRCGLISAGC